MFNTIKKDQVLKTYENEASNLLSQLRDRYYILDHVKAGLTDTIRSDVRDIDEVLRTIIPDGIKVSLPRFRITQSVDGISITVRNKDTNTLEYEYKGSFFYNSNKTNQEMFENISIWWHSIYEELMVAAMQQVNVDIVNDILDGITKKAGVGYSVNVVIPYGQKGRKLSSISDSEIVMVVDPDAIFKIDEVVAFKEPDALVSEKDIEEVRESIANQFATAHTVFEFLDAKFAIMSFICGKTLKRTISLIKDVTHRNIANQSRNVDCLVYYSKDDIFAIAEIKDGNIETVLSPFNVKTFEKVDGVDLVAAAKPM